MAGIKEITLYLVGWDESDAKHNLPFDSFDNAYDYAQDQRDGDIPKIYSVTALVNFDSMKEVS